MTSLNPQESLCSADLSADEITSFLGLIPKGQDPVEAIWDHFFPKLVGYAQRRIKRLPTRACDEEDIAISALYSFFCAVDQQRLDLMCHDEMWKLMITITFRKIAKERRRQFAQKRGGGIQHIGNKSSNDPLSAIPDSSCMPETIEEVFRQCSELIEMLPDEGLRMTAEMKLEGRSNEEISDLFRCRPHVTKARLKQIREIWRRHLNHRDL